MDVVGLVPSVDLIFKVYIKIGSGIVTQIM